MHNVGRSQREVLASLKRCLKENTTYEGGRVLSAMCTIPHPMAKRAHKMFLSANLGDAGLFPGTRKLETDVIRQLSELLNCGNGVGFVVSGGTEANLMALWAARNRANIRSPEAVVPESAHFSFNKICNLLGLKLVHSKLDKFHRAIPEEVERNITKQTVAIIGTAGTPELGVVDPIPELSEIALEHSIHLHVDAAFGGLVIPFLEPDAQKNLMFDFRLPGVMSLTVDPHKMGMSTIPAGGIIFRDKSLLNFIRTGTPYLSEIAQYTFAGTRSGASAAATWAVFESLGREGFQKTIKQCMNVTRLVSKKIEAAGLQLIAEPTLNVIAFRTPNSKRTAAELCRRGWFITYVPHLDCIRIVAMPHFRRQHAEAFIMDLSEIVSSARRGP